MIQRIQSIWLLLASMALLCLFIFPLLTKEADQMTYSLYTTGLHEQRNEAVDTKSKVEFSVVPIALNIAAALFCLGGIFLFRNRSMQKKVILVNILLIIGLSVLCGISVQQIPGGITGLKVEIGAFLLLISIIFSLFAIRGIRKDEQLLRSADRLR